MKYWTRKTEKDAIVTLLESGEYDSAATLADAILKQAWALFEERDWYLAINGNPNRPACWAYGLASTQKEAENLALIAPARVIKVTSSTVKLEEMK